MRPSLPGWSALTQASLCPRSRCCCLAAVARSRTHEPSSIEEQEPPRSSTAKQSAHDQTWYTRISGVAAGPRFAWHALRVPLVVTIHGNDVTVRGKQRDLYRRLQGGQSHGFLKGRNRRRAGGV
jgi:hypothetical protein